MGIGDQLRRRRKEMEMARNEIAKMVHVTPSAIANYENGISYPKLDILVSLMTVLEIDANYLYQDYLTKDLRDVTELNGISREEKEAMEKYSCLTESGKKFVRMIVDQEYERFKKEDWIYMPLWLPGIRKINSGFLIKDEKQVVRLPKKNLLPGTDFCVQIGINRYEPIFQKLDVIAIQKGDAKHNEMGVFCVNGVYYVRNLFRDQHSCRLLALNVMDPEIVIKETDEFFCLGKVLGKVHGNYEIKTDGFLLKEEK